jgi:hypothetical protein
MEQLRELCKHLCEANNELEKVKVQIRQALSDPGNEVNKLDFRLALPSVSVPGSRLQREKSHRQENTRRERTYQTPYGTVTAGVVSKWTLRETEMLVELRRQQYSFKQISQRIPGKTPTQCATRMYTLKDWLEKTH